MATRKLPLSVGNLTRGERLYLHRKRIGYSQIQMAVDQGVCLSEYRSRELDEEGTKVPYVTLSKVEPHEVYTILRRRAGKSRTELGEELQVSAYWVGQMEAGRAPLKRLQEYWEGATDGMED